MVRSFSFPNFHASTKCSDLLWRLAGTAMTRKKPTVFIASDHSIWIGNTSDEDFQCEPGEVFGFGTGAFEEKAIGNSLVPLNLRLLKCLKVLALSSFFAIWPVQDVQERQWPKNLVLVPVKVILARRRTSFHGDWTTICPWSFLRRTFFRSSEALGNWRLKITSWSPSSTQLLSWFSKKDCFARGDNDRVIVGQWHLGQGLVRLGFCFFSRVFHVRRRMARPAPVSFRYQIEPVRSRTTHVYRPNGFTLPADGANMTLPFLGGAFAGNYNKVVCEQRARVLWEAPGLRDERLRVVCLL